MWGLLAAVVLSLNDPDNKVWFESFECIHADDRANYEWYEINHDYVSVCWLQNELNGPEVEDHDPARNQEYKIAGNNRGIVCVVWVQFIALQVVFEKSLTHCHHKLVCIVYLVDRHDKWESQPNCNQYFD